MLAVGRGSGPGAALAASHREAPLISLDAPADISDFFMFRSYEPGHEGNVVLIMDTNPGEEPSSGPNYYNFDPNVTYRFRIDNIRTDVRTTSSSSSSSRVRSEATQQHWDCR